MAWCGITPEVIIDLLFPDPVNEHSPCQKYTHGSNKRSGSYGQVLT